MRPNRAQTDPKRNALLDADCDNSLDGLHSVFKAMGDLRRLQIVRLLAWGSLSVSELCDVFALKQNALSHHLKILVEANLLVRRREGTAIYYRRHLPSGDQAALLKQLLAAIDQQPLPQAMAAGLSRVQNQREQNSLAFFRDHSDLFREQSELIASREDYASGTLHLLDRCGPLTNATLLELGPGDGALLPELAQRAGKVTALDNAKSMLEQAKKTAADISNIEFQLGTCRDLIGTGRQFSVAIANMVLHHTPDPAAVINDLGLLIEEGGHLIISELCAHDQDWARDHCGDLWLGFELEQLTTWATQSGFCNQEFLYVAQRNGFQVQIRLFQKQTL